MNGHVNEFLGAYLDGELSAARRQKVRAHLDECAACQAELESLRRVSTLLQSAPAPEFTPADTFASRLALRLPRRDLPEKSAGRGGLIWYLVPALILAAWFFFQTVLAVSGLAGALEGIRLLPVIRQVSPADGGHTFWFSALTGLFGGWLDGAFHSALVFIDQISLLAAETLGRLFWQALIGLAYLAWLAVWWTRRAPGRLDLRRSQG